MDHIRPKGMTELIRFDYTCLCGKTFPTAITGEGISVGDTGGTVCPSCEREQVLEKEEIKYIIRSVSKGKRKKEPEEAFRFNNTALLDNKVFKYADVTDLQIKGIKDDLRINLFADIAETLEGLDQGYPEDKKYKKEMYFIKVQLEELYDHRVQSHRNGAEFNINAKLETYSIK